MQKVTIEGKTYARITGVGAIYLSDPAERLTLHQAINAKSYLPGLQTRYVRIHKGYFVPEYMRCFMRLCKIKDKKNLDTPNRTGYRQPQSF